MTRATLIAITQPMAHTEIPDAEALVAYCARVSAPKNQDKHETATGLLRYLIKHKHWSPWEMAHAVVEVETTRDIARQVLRHRSFSFQEFSQRYAEVLSFVTRLVRRQDLKNRQNSIDDLPKWKRAFWAVAVWILIRYVALIYSFALRINIAKETARSILPEGLTPSRLYMAGNLRSWMHYLAVRRGNGTQLEHIQLADAIFEALRPAFPITMEILEEASLAEGKMP